MGIYQVVHKYTWLSQQARNVFYYETTVGEPSTSEWQDIADEIRAEFVTNMQSGISDTCALNGIDYRRVDLAGIPSFPVSFTSGTVSGTNAAEPVPTQIALLVSAKVATTKPNRVRSYLPGFCESQVTDSLWNSGTLSTAETWIDFQSVLNAGGTNPLQRVAVQWNAGHTAIAASNNISGASSIGAIVPATQRRRRIGVGI